MGEAIGAVLAFGMGVALSPIPIIATILTLLSPTAKRNGPLFLLGWVTGLLVLVTVAYLAADGLDLGSGTAEDETSWIRAVLGVLLLVAAVRKWRSRPTDADEAELPGWMAGIQEASAGRALGLGALVSANPKNLAFAAGAGAALVQVLPTTGEAVAGIVAFAVLGSLSVAIPVVYAVAGGERSRASLDEAKAWLTVHNGAVMAVLFLVFGTLLLSQALAGGA